MHPALLRLSLALGLAVAFSPAGARFALAETPLTTVRVAQGLSLPLFVTAPPGDTTRLFIVEQRGGDNRGRIKILKNGIVLSRAFLTTPVLATGSEQGLLGLAFAPDYAATGRFYINYTRPDWTTVVERHTVSADPDSADPAGTAILTVTQPFDNHNGGWLGFGPDGYLYVSLGDGGAGGDPGDRAQNLGELLGKILRLDVSGPTYSIPPTNPFAGAIVGRDEIWAYGLRNPWRPSFDRETGDFIIADVGQNSIEEVDFAPYTSTGGENYGWRCYEGSALYSESATTPCGFCAAPACPKVFPAYQYDHSLGRCSITGGYVYRGCAIPDLEGEYFFGDYCAATVYSGRFVGGTLPVVRERTAELAPGGGLSIGFISSFGEDARGELYVCDWSGGEVFKIVPKAPVLERDMPTLRVRAATGDTLGTTAPGNAILIPGITPFADAGGRIRGVGYVSASTIRECTTINGSCLDSHMRLGSFDVDVQGCVVPATSMLTRRFIFTNRSQSPQNLAYVDVITPRLQGNEDGATTVAPAGPGGSAVLALYDSFNPTLYVRHWGTGSSGVTYTADVDTASQLAARIAADQPLAGGVSAGPASVGLALGFAFGMVAPAAVETVTVFTALQTSPPSGVGGDAVPPVGIFSVSPVPFRSDLAIRVAAPRAGDVSLDIYDVGGRRVRRIYRGALGKAPADFHWDGRTDGGRQAPAGVYFARLSGDGWSEVRRAVRLR